MNDGHRVRLKVRPVTEPGLSADFDLFECPPHATTFACGGWSTMAPSEFGRLLARFRRMPCLASPAGADSRALAPRSLTRAGPGSLLTAPYDSILRRASRRISRAALCPGTPVTPPPG